MRRALLAAFLILEGISAALAAAAERPLLQPGQAVERPIAPGEQYLYEVRGHSGQFVSVTLERRGTWALVVLEEPSSGTVVTGNSDSGPGGTVRVLGLMGDSGILNVTVRVPDYGTSGSYRLWIDPLMSADAGHRLRVAAQTAGTKAGWEPQTQTAEGRAQWIRDGSEAVTLWRRSGDERGLAEQLTRRAFALFFSGSPKEALADHNEALELWLRLGDRPGSAASWNGMGMAFSYMAEYSRALEQYERALDTYRALGDPWGQARELSNMSVAYASLDDLEKARDCLERSLPLRRAAQDRRGEAYTLGNLADYEATGALSRRLELKTRAVALAAEAGDRMLEGQLMADIGRLQARSGDEVRALETFERALEKLRASGNTRVEGRTVSEIGAVKARGGKTSDALASYAEAVELHRKAKDRGGEALTYLRIGGAYAIQGEQRQARDAYAHALGIYRTTANAHGEAEVLIAEARLDRNFGLAAEARSRVDEALALIESLRARMARREDRALYSARWQDAYRLSMEIYLQQHAASPGAGFDGRAFHEAERARARAIVESVAESRLNISAALPEDLRRREAELSSKLSDLQKRLSAAVGDRRALEEEIFEAEAAWSRLVVEIRARSPRYASLRYPEAITAERARALCDGQMAVVSYVLGEERSRVFVLTAAGLRVAVLPVTSSRISEAVQSYVGLLGGAAGDRAEELGRRLEADLVEPWRRHLPAGVKRLVIVPDGDLHSLPFEALPESAAGGRRLIDDFVVSYVPSVTLLAELSAVERSRPRGHEVNVLAFAAPPTPSSLADATFEGSRLSLGPLPDAAGEARSVVRFGGKASRVHIGQDASESRLKGENLEQFGVLHFATHTLLAQEVPSRSALVLAAAEGEHEDGLLQAREIYLLKLRSELVVLSGCRTARGKILAGEGVQGLAQAFFHAGASTSVASLWDVSDRRTAELMEAFYRHMAEGLSKAESLRSAKLDLLRREPNLAPRYWASFVLLGEPAGILPLRAPSWWERLF